MAPDCMKVKLPKLILQPFIENSFFHAFKDRNTGYICVMISRDGDTLVCEVRDNGVGMELNAGTGKYPNPKSRQLFSGIGINNVHDRILLLYGENYGVTIESKLGQGTQVSIRLPWQEH